MISNCYTGSAPPGNIGHLALWVKPQVVTGSFSSVKEILLTRIKTKKYTTGISFDTYPLWYSHLKPEESRSHPPNFHHRFPAICCKTARDSQVSVRNQPRHLATRSLRIQATYLWRCGWPRWPPQVGPRGAVKNGPRIGWVAENSHDQSPFTAYNCFKSFARSAVRVGR